MFRPALICALVFGMLPSPAGAATLKPYTALDGPVVRLSDLFDGADARPLGPAPAPGARILVEAPQLLAIAHMFAVDWRPAGPGDRAILERPGRTLTRDDVLAPLRAVLLQAGAPDDSDVDLPLPSLAPLPAGTPVTLSFTGTEYDAGSGRFTTLLQADAAGIAPAQARLSGRVQAMVELPVLRRAMLPGDVVLAPDLQWTRLRLGLARGDIVRAAAQAEGQSLRRPLQPGQPIQLADLGRPVVVTKGQPLVLTLESAGLSLTAQGVANEPGALNERIHVTNPYSRAILEADVTGPGRARVVPGSVPTPPAARQVALR